MDELAILVVSVVPVAASLLASLGKYLKARREKNIKIMVNGDVLELNSADAEDAERIIAEFLSRHSGSPSKVAE